MQLHCVIHTCRTPSRVIMQCKAPLCLCSESVTGLCTCRIRQLNLTVRLLTWHTGRTARPMFCRTRSRSRSRTVAASVTTVNGAGDGGRKASLILLRPHLSSPLDRLPRIRDGVPGSRPCRCRQGRMLFAWVVWGYRRGYELTVSDSRGRASTWTPLCNGRISRTTRPISPCIRLSPLPLDTWRKANPVDIL